MTAHKMKTDAEKHDLRKNRMEVYQTVILL